MESNKGWKLAEVLEYAVDESSVACTTTDLSPTDFYTEKQMLPRGQERSIMDGLSGTIQPAVNVRVSNRLKLGESR